MKHGSLVVLSALALAMFACPANAQVVRVVEDETVVMTTTRVVDVVPVRIPIEEVETVRVYTKFDPNGPRIAPIPDGLPRSNRYVLVTDAVKVDKPRKTVEKSTTTVTSSSSNGYSGYSSVTYSCEGGVCRPVNSSAPRRGLFGRRRW